MFGTPLVMLKMKIFGQVFRGKSERKTKINFPSESLKAKKTEKQ